MFWSNIDSIDINIWFTTKYHEICVLNVLTCFDSIYKVFYNCFHSSLFVFCSKFCQNKMKNTIKIIKTKTEMEIQSKQVCFVNILIVFVIFWWYIDIVLTLVFVLILIDFSHYIVWKQFDAERYKVIVFAAIHDHTYQLCW